MYVRHTYIFLKKDFFFFKYKESFQFSKLLFHFLCNHVEGGELLTTQKSFLFHDINHRDGGKRVSITTQRVNSCFLSSEGIYTQSSLNNILEFYSSETPFGKENTFKMGKKKNHHLQSNLSSCTTMQSRDFLQ